MSDSYYGPIDSPQRAIYEAACAMDNQDFPLEEWPDKIIEALGRAGFSVVPHALPTEVLGDAFIAGVFDTGNPKHGWDYLLARVQAQRSQQEGER